MSNDIDCKSKTSSLTYSHAEFPFLIASLDKSLINLIHFSKVHPKYIKTHGETSEVEHLHKLICIDSRARDYKGYLNL